VRGFEPGDAVFAMLDRDHGGAGGVGHLAIQLAKARGALVSTTVSADDVSFARELGADHVVDYRNERFEQHVRNVDLVFDLVDGDTQERSWNVLNRGGSLVSTLKTPSAEKAAMLGAHAGHYLAQHALESGHPRGKIVVQMSA